MSRRAGGEGSLRPALRGSGNDHAIVFIHGLGGAPLSTWGAMLELMEGDAGFDHITLDCYSYPTRLVEIPFLARGPGLKELAEGLRTFLRDRFEGYRRVDLVAHSLGGVVTKAFLAREFSESKGQAVQVRKVALIAVPNAGSSLASLARLVSFQHRQLKALCKNSAELAATDRSWTESKANEILEVEYIMGGKDRCVSRESACIDSNATPSMLINADHRDIVTPKSRGDSRYTVLSKFLLSDANGRSAPVRPADPLFEQYKPEHEPYYVERTFDHGISNAISAGHIWICGESGVGKSAALRRAVYRNQWQLRHISLSAYSDASPLGMIYALADELSILAKNEPFTLIERSFEAACHSIRSSLCDLCNSGPQALVVEEIPLGENALPEFLDHLLRLVHLINGTDLIANHLIIAFSSICDLTSAGLSIPEKTRECIQIIPDPRWSLDDLNRLARMLCVHLGLGFSDTEIEQICAAADGRPRLVKQLFRLYRNKLDHGETLTVLIQRVQSEQI